MMQKRTLYSLLLTSFILVCAFSLSSAQEVTVESATGLQRCVTDTLDITITNPMDISAYEIVLSVSGDIGVVQVLHSEPASWDVFDTVGAGVVRLIGMMLDPAASCLAAGGPTVVAQLEITTDNVCQGTATLDGTSYSPCPSTPVTAQTQFVDCATTTLVPAAVNAGTVTIDNLPPAITCPPNDSIHWGTTYLGQATATDPDLVNGCEKLTYSKKSGPANLTVNAATGAISWPTLGPDVGIWTVCIEVTDSCGAVDDCCFDICVWNIPPTITCPTDTSNNIWGYTVTGQVTGFDPDGGPSPLLYKVVSFSGPGTVTINPATGAWEWPTLEDNAYLGVFQLCLEVTDGANVAPGCSPRNADTCCLYIRVIPTIRAFIEKTHDTYQGRMEYVSIYLDDAINPPNEMGGFDLLIAYDRSALNFQMATPGALLAYCGWEYFTYRWWFWPSYEPHFFWGGIVRLVAFAETNNGAGNHPSCFAPGPAELAVLHFMVTDNRLFECQYVPIRFFWTDCGDNTFSSVTGDTLFISRHIYEYTDTAGVNPIEDLYAPFPSYFGANYTCDVDTGDGKPDPLRIVDFWNGGVDIICAESIDARGDINLNGIPNEVADAVVFTNYFIYGFGAFHVNLDGQIAATDVNADGLTLTVGDLVYLVRVIVGDALPYPKVTTPVAASYVHGHDGVLRVTDEVSMGAAYVVARGEVTPQLLAPDMELKYNFDGANTRMLVYSLEGNSFTGAFLQVPGEIVSIEMATREGNPVVAELVPADFALHQNYPNPFNPITTMSLSLPTASDYSLTIYNVSGQEVARFDGSAGPGVVQVVWDAGDLASGIYFYKLVAGDFSATKKMVLLK